MLTTEKLLYSATLTTTIKRHIMTQNTSKYKWAILWTVFAALIPCNYNQFQASILAGELISKIGMTTQQFVAALTAPMLVGFFIGIAGGVLADKIGSKKTVIMSITISAIGCFMRIFALNSQSYGMFFAAMLLLGFNGTIITLCSAKLFAAWFQPQELGVAMGVMMASGGIAMTLSQATTAFFPSANAAFGFGGTWMAAMLIVWLLVIKDRPEGAPIPEPQPVLKPLIISLKSLNVWIIGIGAACFMGFQLSIASFYPSALQSIGFELATAGLYASIFTFGGFLGNIFVPSIAAKVGLNKPVLIIAGILGGLSIYIGWNYCTGLTMAVIIAIGGFFGCGITPPLLSYPPLLPEIGHQNAASASGFITSIMMLAGFVLPSYVVTPLASGADGSVIFGTVFTIAAVFCVLQGVIALILPEFGAKARKA